MAGDYASGRAPDMKLQFWHILCLMISRNSFGQSFTGTFARLTDVSWLLHPLAADRHALGAGVGAGKERQIPVAGRHIHQNPEMRRHVMAADHHRIVVGAARIASRAPLQPRCALRRQPGFHRS